MSEMIYISSPWRATGKTAKLRAYQRRHHAELVEKACKFVAECGDIPIAPHLYFTQFLDDDTPEERSLGMTLGLEAIEYCDAMYVFTDGVISDGMMNELQVAADLDLPVRMFNFFDPDTGFEENEHIMDLVQNLKEHRWDEDADEDDEDEDESYDEEDLEDDEYEDSDCTAPGGIRIGFDHVHYGSVEELIDSILDDFFEFLDSDNDHMDIKLRKPEGWNEESSSHSTSGNSRGKGSNDNHYNSHHKKVR